MQIPSTSAGRSPAGALSSSTAAAERRSTRPTDPTAAAEAATASSTASRGGFSVLNDFRYLTSSDKDLIGAVTGEVIDPGYVEKATPASQFALQLALDRRTGELAPQQEVTAVYLQNRSHEIDKINAGRHGARNPYSGAVLADAVEHLTAHGRARADIRL